MDTTALVKDVQDSVKSVEPHVLTFDRPAVGAVALEVSGCRTIRRGQGYSVRVTAPLTLHQDVLKQCAAFAADDSAPAGRKADRTYADRIAAATGMS